MVESFKVLVDTLLFGYVSDTRCQEILLEYKEKICTELERTKDFPQLFQLLSSISAALLQQRKRRSDSEELQGFGASVLQYYVLSSGVFLDSRSSHFLLVGLSVLQQFPIQDFTTHTFETIEKYMKPLLDIRHILEDEDKILLGKLYFLLVQIRLLFPHAELKQKCKYVRQC